MPLYSEKLLVPANTLKANPVSIDIVIKEKFITKIVIGFEDGCAWMVGAKVQYGIKMLWPDRPETWLYGNEAVFEWDERFEMPAVNEKLTFYAHSEGTKYPHNVFIAITTLPKGFYFLEKLLEMLYKFWEKLI